ncbi:prominin-1-A isoform X2 [Odontomachus brunneus]|uniref:prominin-1-A isoform X2 n=1 Tax=Odontomachus brunneus TaxID=486640 RepID=UPI0013F1F6F2|nr:prominin-1-A isoform X2 [Odontomachus brunneus]
MVVIKAFLLVVATSRAYTLQESVSTDSAPGGNNCSTTDSFLILPFSNETREGEMDTTADVLTDGTKNNPNVSHPRTLTSPNDWDEKPRLKFPKFTAEKRYKMASLHLDKGWFAFDFLRGFLSFIQPYDVPTDVEELLGRPVQAELSAETGLDVALDALVDLANATQELSARVESLLREGEKAHELGSELSRETDEIRRDLEGAVRACSGPDRSLCAVIDSSGIRLDLRIERLLRDDRLLRLRSTSRENLTEAGRQARGEYLHVPHHIARTTLDVRNQIRREINAARARIVDQTRNIETSSFELSKQLDLAKSATDYVIPRVIAFEHVRWIVGTATVLCVLPVFSLLIGALCCRCSSSDDKVRPALLCGVVTSCFVSIALWAVFVVALGISSHTEMLICRPLYDPDYRAIGAVLETRAFLGRRLTVPLKELFEKCRNNEAAYPAFGLENTMKLEHFTAHWTWPGLSRAISGIKVDLKGLEILTPNLRQRLQDLLHACGLNITAYRITIQGPILSKDLNTMSYQLDNISRQLQDRSIARELQSVGITMRDLTLRRVKPLMKLQDDLVYQLALLELQVQPLWRQVNQSISHLRTIQYYIDHRGEKIAQLKTKSYVDRLANYLDQWRAHVLAETSTGVSKCRPLWDVLQGFRHLLCAHILSPLNGFWLAVFVCVVVMVASTPIAHILSLVYKRSSHFARDVILLPTRTESLNTDTYDRAWQTPEPPPPPQRDW